MEININYYIDKMEDLLTLAENYHHFPLNRKIVHAYNKTVINKYHLRVAESNMLGRDFKALYNQLSDHEKETVRINFLLLVDGKSKTSLKDTLTKVIITCFVIGFISFLILFIRYHLLTNSDPSDSALIDIITKLLDSSGKFL